MKLRDKLTLLNIDCMEYMATVPDKYFDLAVVDPPYNVSASNGRFGGKKSKPSLVSNKRNAKHYANHNTTPNGEYFKELFRISKNQIIWGSNYYPQHLYHSGAIVWDKLTTGPLSDCEIAFQSFNKLVEKYTQAWSGFNKGGEVTIRVHPNQKPVRLYDWIYDRYASENCKVIDTHLGSGSNAIAGHYSDKVSEFVGCELDKDYYNDMIKRVRKDTEQLKLF